MKATIVGGPHRPPWLSGRFYFSGVKAGIGAGQGVAVIADESKKAGLSDFNGGRFRRRGVMKKRWAHSCIAQ
jgi:hypothetical protein